MDRMFLVMASLFAGSGVALGAFGAHALQRKIPVERLATFETGVRYQLWHALALFAVVFVRAWRPVSVGNVYAPLVSLSSGSPATILSGWLFVAGIVLFSGSLYGLALTGVRRFGVVAPLGGLCLLGGWFALAFATATR